MKLFVFVTRVFKLVTVLPVGARISGSVTSTPGLTQNTFTNLVFGVAVSVVSTVTFREVPGTSGLFVPICGTTF